MSSPHSTRATAWGDLEVYKGHGLGGDAAGGGPEGAGGILCKAGIFDQCVDRLGTARQSEWRGDDGGNLYGLTLLCPGERRFAARAGEAEIGRTYWNWYIKDTRWVEMLHQADRKMLAASYVRRGFLDSLLVAWALRGCESGVVTTEAMRKKVQDELNNLLQVQREVAEMAIQIAASWTQEYRDREPRDWREHLDTDVHLKDVLKECLDYMAVVVEAGVETGKAMPYVVKCIQTDRKSGVSSLDRASLDGFVAELTWAGTGRAHAPLGRVDMLLKCLGELYM